MELVNRILWELRSLPKIILIKIRYRNSVDISWIEDIFPRVRIVVKNGKLEVGKGCHIKSGSDIDVRDGGILKIGNHVCINSNVHISSIKKIEIGDYCEFGPNIVIVDQDHDFRDCRGITGQKYKTGDVSIGKNVWVGANVVILKNTVIGDNCVVAAGSVIQGFFPDSTVITQKRNTQVTSYRRNMD